MYVLLYLQGRLSPRFQSGEKRRSKSIRRPATFEITYASPDYCRRLALRSLLSLRLVICKMKSQPVLGSNALQEYQSVTKAG